MAQSSAGFTTQRALEYSRAEYQAGSLGRRDGDEPDHPDVGQRPTWIISQAQTTEHQVIMPESATTST